jgi:hypothetical protein
MRFQLFKARLTFPPMLEMHSRLSDFILAGSDAFRQRVFLPQVRVHFRHSHRWPKRQNYAEIKW